MITRRRMRWLAGLTVLVTLAHLLLTNEVATQMDELSPDQPGIKRMEATYVRELKLTQAPRAAAVAAPVTAGAANTVKPKVRKPRAAESAASKASAPDESASAPQLAEAASAPASAAQDVAQAASTPTPAASVPAAFASASQAKPATPVFVWPKATKVSFSLEGYYRGPIYGQASVEWIRQDKRYQVHVDASLGPSFAPIGSWRLTSEGEIRPDGLYPQRYEHVNRLLISTSAPRMVQLLDDEVIMEKGKRAPRAKGVQDPASQLIQLAYRFILNPDLLTTGKTIEIPLVNLKLAEMLAYDVVGEEILNTPIGQIPTIHIKPRRPESADAGSLPADIWVAPGLQYLPVRILVRLDEKTFMDMKLKSAPQMAADDAPKKAPAPTSP
ncbi:DUF3108 domain-containing protein [Aquabacterium sp.]|uniref:DUF3108 domain-containing protein n=1 Tax=Aquabacterium sp. TaxID=1872578 RepID=UPI003B710677